MKVQLKSELKYTQYLWGDLKEICNQFLDVLEESWGKDSYLCISGKGLVDVDKRDILI